MAEVKRGRIPPTAKADFALITDEEKLALQEKALKSVLAEKRAKALEEYEKAALDEARRGEGVEEELVTFILDLADFADRITIDGVIFFHGREYTVPRSKYQTMIDMAYQTHKHQLETDGKNKNRWRGWGDSRIGQKGVTPHGVINTSKLMRA